MILFDDALLKAYFSGLIDKNQLYEYCRNPDEMRRKIG